MSQTRLGSLVEQLLNIGSGFVISCLLWEFVVKPLWHIQTDFAENLQITALFTVVSIVRGYAWRRLFVRAGKPGRLAAIIRRIRLGLTDLPGYGPHPGTDVLVCMLLMGAFAGAGNGGWWGALGGAGLFALFMVPMYLIGAHDRGWEYEARLDREERRS